jgi:hypothetical protein
VLNILVPLARVGVWDSWEVIADITEYRTPTWKQIILTGLQTGRDRYQPAVLFAGLQAISGIRRNVFLVLITECHNFLLAPCAECADRFVSSVLFRPEVRATSWEEHDPLVCPRRGLSDLPSLSFDIRNSSKLYLKFSSYQAENIFRLWRLLSSGMLRHIVS